MSVILLVSIIVGFAAIFCGGLALLAKVSLYAAELVAAGLMLLFLPIFGIMLLSL